MAYLGNGPGVASQRITDTFSVSTSTSTFTPSAGYTVGYLDVYHNGVKLVNGDDYTASNGSTFVLTSAANDGDTVECVAYIPRGLSDGYTKAEADSRYLPIDAVTLPSQTGNSGKYLTTDGTNASWATVTMPDEIRDPINTSPANGSTNLGNGGFSLVSSAFKSLYGETHAASQWQISTSSSFATTVVDTGDSASLTSYTVGAVLSVNTTYYWRVKYKDSNGSYSDWSAATTFVTSSVFSYSMEVLLVAGGGGGSLNIAGGGAGGLVSESLTAQLAKSYTIVVGAGGAADSAASGNGSNSVMTDISTAIGGGKGSGTSGGYYLAGSGGSGGGGMDISGYTTGGTGTNGQGYKGGDARLASPVGGGGGGGAGSAGANADASGIGGSGGIGFNWKSLGVYYAGGGGGAGINGISLGGAGGGGNGGKGGLSASTQGVSNTGGGGGGGYAISGASGGSGICIIRYSGSQRGTGGTVTSSGGYTYHTFTTSGTFTA